MEKEIKPTVHAEGKIPEKEHGLVEDHEVKE